MAEYYFDIETYSPQDMPNPETDKIISIQFQRIDLRTGKPRENIFVNYLSQSFILLSPFNIFKRFLHFL